MSASHLATGSACPPKVPGKLRLYSMCFCPFALRARLILLVKDVPHDIVNVDLKKKPEWIFDLHPEGKVPALDDNGNIIVESIVVADYLDEKYPEPPMYPKEEAAKAKDKELIKLNDGVLQVMLPILLGKDVPIEDFRRDLKPHLDRMEKELGDRNTTFFSGKPLKTLSA